MNTRVFATQGRYKFVSDIRDIAVDSTKRQEVYEWASENHVIIEYQGTLGGRDVWRVRDEERRMWFMLRWI